jgi:hypothetical protein
VGLVAYLKVAGARATVADPSGGTCDAAGDFDRLLPLDQHAYPLLSQIDPHGDLTLSGGQIRAALAEVDRLLTTATMTPVERRGLLRLRPLLADGARERTARLIIIGD